MFQRLRCTEELKKTKKDKPLKTLLEEACEKYNDKMKRKRAYIITGPSRNFMNSLAKIPTAAIDQLQMHYLKYRHKESGALCLLSLNATCHTHMCKNPPLVCNMP